MLVELHLHSPQSHSPVYCFCISKAHPRASSSTVSKSRRSSWELMSTLSLTLHSSSLGFSYTSSASASWNALGSVFPWGSLNPPIFPELVGPLDLAHLPQTPRAAPATRANGHDEDADIDEYQVERLKNEDTFFFVRARCLSAGLRSWVLLTDQQGIEPPPAVCQRHKSDAIPTQPQGRLSQEWGPQGPHFIYSPCECSVIWRWQVPHNRQLRDWPRLGATRWSNRLVGQWELTAHRGCPRRSLEWLQHGASAWGITWVGWHACQWSGNFTFAGNGSFD